ncbi:hypothetical protein BpHYR1_046974 [Brachionus plicatilis]|uniref:Uncharacterized protein n=1 Tax=Brachionus plicatilis TaxID=10195 RepID=A0A3M7SDY3_BRAPC|nr:hypothetical protein BpHYR1_046974 [Brachionus plicatilis]
MKNSHLLLEFDEEFKIYYDNKFEIFSKAASRFVKDEPLQYEYVEYKCLHWRKPLLFPGLTILRKDILSLRSHTLKKYLKIFLD